MPHRLFSACVILSLLVALNPVSLPKLTGVVVGVPLELYDAISNSLKWTGAVGAGSTVTLRFNATLNVPGDSVINIVTIDDGVGKILQRVAGGRRVFLPLIWR